MDCVVCLDLDGTLLRPNKTISEFSVRVLQKLHQSGVDIMIATGRQYRVAKALVSALGFDVTIFYANGAAARTTRGDEKLFSLPLDADTVQKIRLLAEEYPVAGMAHMDYGHVPELCSLSRYGDDVIHEYALDLDLSVDSLSSDMSTEEALSLVFIGALEDLFQLEKGIHQSQIPSSFHVMQNAVQVSLLEVMHPDISKGKSLLRFLEMDGSDEKEVIAIGDDMNDLSLLRAATTGVAMKNATPDLLACADAVTAYTNAEDGVAHFLLDHFNQSI